MSTMRTEFPMTEGVLLLRQGDKTMAVHLTSVVAILEAIATCAPDFGRGYVTNYRETLDHYAVEATGKADRIFMWTGPDPFAKAEIEASRAEVEA